MSAAAVVLAAGGGTRFAGAGHKLLTPFRGRPLVTWAVDAAREAALDETIVVWGAVDLGGIVDADVVLVHNADWSQGQATSLRVALDRATAAGHDAVVVGLGDQPLVPAGAWRSVAAAPDDPPIAVATYAGQRRNPVRLARAVWALLPTTGDEGARRVMREKPHLVREVACAGEAADIDTAEDLSRWS